MGTFNETGAAGLKLVREAGETKMNEIRAHMVRLLPCSSCALLRLVVVGVAVGV